MKIYVNFKPADNIPDFLKQLFINGSDGSGLTLGFVPTYSNEACTEVQTGPHRMRSFDDIYYIVNTYFPNTSPERLFHLLITLDLHVKLEGIYKTHSAYVKYEGNKRYPHFNNCSTMRRVRLIWGYVHEKEPIKLDGTDFYATHYDSKWSWKDLLESIGIKLEGDYTNSIGTNNDYKKVLDYIHKYSPYKKLNYEETVKT